MHAKHAATQRLPRAWEYVMLPDLFVTCDLGLEEFSTWAEMCELVREAHHVAPAPLVAVYITPWQQKLLRLEAFERRRLTNDQARRLEFKSVAGTRIWVWDGDGIPPCPNCGSQHG